MPADEYRTQMQAIINRRILSMEDYSAYGSISPSCECSSYHERQTKQPETFSKPLACVGIPATLAVQILHRYVVRAISPRNLDFF